MYYSQEYKSKRPYLLMVLSLFLLPVLVRALPGDYKESMMTSDGKLRTYLLHTPPGYDGQEGLPLVLNLHFYGGTGEAQAAVTGMSGKADAENFIVVYPDGLGSPAGWNDYDSLFVRELIDTVCSRYAVDSTRIYMTGYSAGALMSYWMACKLSGRIAAFAPVAGTMLTYDWSGCYPDKPLSIISFNARDDQLVPYAGDGEYLKGVENTMADWANRLECDIGPDTFCNEQGALRQTWSRPDSTCELALWTTDEGDHMWPTDSSPHKLSANDLMWEFFKTHPLTDWKPGVEEARPEATDYPLVELDPNNPYLTGKSAAIRFSLPEPGYVRIDIFDALGRRVAVALEGIVDKGEHKLNFVSENIRSGVYFYRLSTLQGTQTKKIIVVK